MRIIDQIMPFKSQYKTKTFNLKGKKALIVTTSQATLDIIDETTDTVIKIGKPTGVYAAEMTEPYYEFLDAGMEIDIASIKGGKIPIEKLSLMWPVATKHDQRFKNDKLFKSKVYNSLEISNANINDYDILFMSGGWGAAYDLMQSNDLNQKISEAYAKKKILGSVCHGALGFIGAIKPDKSPLVKGVKMTGVTNKQLSELGVGVTPKHPETELRNAGALYEFSTNPIKDFFANHVVVDEKHLIVTGQNQKGGVETAQKAMELLISTSKK